MLGLTAAVEAPARAPSCPAPQPALLLCPPVPLALQIVYAILGLYAGLAAWAISSGNKKSHAALLAMPKPTRPDYTSREYAQSCRRRAGVPSPSCLAPFPASSACPCAHPAAFYSSILLLLFPPNPASSAFPFRPSLLVLPVLLASIIAIPPAAIPAASGMPEFGTAEWEKFIEGEGNMEKCFEELGK